MGTHKRDSFSNVPLSEDPIFLELQKHAAGDEALEREEERFAELVANFASLIRDDVRRELKSRPADEFSQKYVAAAQALLAYDDSGGDSGSTEEERKAARLVREAIAAELQKGVLPPDEEDTEDHVQVLAQLLLSNWFFLLQQANRLRLGSAPQPLNMQALPRNLFASSMLYGGTESYALTSNVLEGHFKNFLARIRANLLADAVGKVLGKASAKVIELAPDLVLVASGDSEWHLVASIREAEAFVETLDRRTGPARPPVGEMPSADWVIAGLSAFDWGREPEWSAATLRLAINAAMLETIQGANSGMGADAPAAAHYGRAIDAVSEEMAQITKMELDYVIEPNPVSSAALYDSINATIARMCAKLEAIEGFNAPVLETCQVFLGAATGVAAAAVSAQPARPEAIIAVGRANVPAEAKIVVTVATHAAQRVLAMPKIRTSAAQGFALLGRLHVKDRA
jgi:hypothetical protein